MRTFSEFTFQVAAFMRSTTIVVAKRNFSCNSAFCTTESKCRIPVVVPWGSGDPSKWGESPRWIWQGCRIHRIRNGAA